MRGPALAVLVAFIAIGLTPSDAYAWTPGTHVFLGEAVLAALPLLPPAIADLLRAFPHDFLYGSIAADTSIAKKYAPAGRHCHSWTVGLDVYEEAREEPLRAFALGYLSHLAADAIAHNYFVPMRLAVTSSSAGIGHSYWESRFETHLGSDYSRRARELILLDHSQAEGLLDRVLSPTIFSTPTKSPDLPRMVYVADTESWQRIFQLMTEKSRWDLPDHDVSGYLARSFDVVGRLFLRRLERAEAFSARPAGTKHLRMAKASVGRRARRWRDLLLERAIVALRHAAKPGLRARAPRTALLAEPLG